MILLDFSQVCRAAIAQERAGNPNMPIEENLVRHFIFNSVRYNYVKFKKEYGEMIICADSRSWRKSHFSHYKANRVHEDNEEWEIIRKVINESYDIFDKHSPFKCVKVPGAEADDIIAWYANKHGVTVKDDIFGGIGTDVEDILIISGDKDFQQLQVYKNVYQYSPTLKKFIKCPDPVDQWMELIIKGDVGDGVPNVLSIDNALVDKIRQTPITAKFLSNVKEHWCDPENVTCKLSPTEFVRNLHRNIKLIDLLGNIPEDVQNSIEEVVKSHNEGSLELLRQAFIAHRMKNMLDVLGDFKVNR